MGDNGHSGGGDEELTLPRATVAKLINGESTYMLAALFDAGIFA